MLKALKKSRFKQKHNQGDNSLSNFYAAFWRVSYGSWETFKVVECYLILQLWKAMDVKCRSWKLCLWYKNNNKLLSSSLTCLTVIPPFAFAARAPIYGYASCNGVVRDTSVFLPVQPQFTCPIIWAPAHTGKLLVKNASEANIFCLASDIPVSTEQRKRPPPLPAVHPEASIEHGTSCNTTDQALKLTGTSPLNSALPWTYSPLQPGLTLNNSA